VELEGRAYKIKKSNSYLRGFGCLEVNETFYYAVTSNKYTNNSNQQGGTT